jgi:hypothetical protein
VANYQYSSDLINDALFRAGEPTDGTSDYEAAALRYLNRAYQALWEGGAEFLPEMREPWWWLRKHDAFILEPVIDTGTVQVTQGSATVTFTAAPTPEVDTTVSGWLFKTASHPDVYVISTHVALAVNATLDEIWTGSDASAASYSLMKIDYPLPADCMHVLEPMRAYQDSRNEVVGMAESSLYDAYPLNQIQKAIPRYFCAYDEDTVRFNSAPRELTRIDYMYLYRPAALTDSGSEEPIVPIQYRRILALMASYWILQDKDDTRRTEMAAEARSLATGMQRENKTRWARQGRAARIYTRQRSRFRGPLRTESGHLLGY